jgi:hypothetical protein
MIKKFQLHTEYLHLTRVKLLLNNTSIPGQEIFVLIPKIIINYLIYITMFSLEIQYIFSSNGNSI